MSSWKLVFMPLKFLKISYLRVSPFTKSCKVLSNCDTIQSSLSNRLRMFAHSPDLIKLNPNKIHEMLCPETTWIKKTNHETRAKRHNCQKKELCLWIKKIKPTFFLISYKSVRLDMTTNDFFSRSLLVVDPHPELD